MRGLHNAWQHPLAERHACSLSLRLRKPGRGCSVPILARRWRKAITTITSPSLERPCRVRVGSSSKTCTALARGNPVPRSERVWLHLAAEEATLDIIS